MDFPAFSSICSSNKAECGVNFSRFPTFLVGSPGEFCVAEKTKRGRDKESKRGREEGAKRRRDEERKRQRDKKTKTTSPPIRVLFTAQFVQFLFNSCPKTFARFVSKTVLHNRTPLCESSVKVNVGGKVGVGGTGK